MELGYLEAGTKMNLRNDTNDKTMLCEVFRFNFERLDLLVQKINEFSTMELTKWTDTNISYTINSNRDGVIFMSMPYDKGWKVYVDGNKVESEKVFETFMGVNITTGEHTIELKYTPSGIILGSLISLIGIICLITIWIYKNKRKKD